MVKKSSVSCFDHFKKLTNFPGNFTPYHVFSRSETPDQLLRDSSELAPRETLFYGPALHCYTPYTISRYIVPPATRTEHIAGLKAKVLLLPKWRMQSKKWWKDVRLLKKMEGLWVRSYHI